MCFRSKLICKLPRGDSFLRHLPVPIIRDGSSVCDSCRGTGRGNERERKSELTSLVLYRISLQVYLSVLPQIIDIVINYLFFS